MSDSERFVDVIENDGEFLIGETIRETSVFCLRSTASNVADAVFKAQSLATDRGLVIEIVADNRARQALQDVRKNETKE